MSIVDKLNAIQVALNAPKGQTNTFSNFNYRSCEDIMKALKPILDGCIVTVSDDIKMIGDRIYIQATATIRHGDESLSVTGFARETADKKGMDHAQITGSASSYARKYAMNGLFLIDDNKDADSQDNSSVAIPAVLTAMDKQWIAAVKADMSQLDSITDPTYREFIKKESAK